MRREEKHMVKGCVLKGAGWDMGKGSARVSPEGGIALIVIRILSTCHRVIVFPEFLFITHQSINRCIQLKLIFHEYESRSIYTPLFKLQKKNHNSF